MVRPVAKVAMAVQAVPEALVVERELLRRQVTAERSTLEVLWAHMHETDRALVQEAFA